MSHQIEQEDGIAYTGQVPWHGIGADVPAGSSIEVWMKAANLEYSVLEAPVQFETADSMEEVPDKKVLYCSDNKLSLSVVSQGYKVVQPSDIFDVYREIAHAHDLEIETCGSLNNRKKVWALARVPEESLRIMGQDEVKPYILLGTSYDTSMATVAQFTSVRVVCNNTLQASLSNDSGLRIPHSQTVSTDRIANALLYNVQDWKEFGEGATELAGRKVKEKEMIGYFAYLLFGDEADEEELNGAGRAKMNQLVGLYRAGSGAQLRSSQGTAWGMVNAVTEYVDHYKGSTPATRLNAAWFGEGKNLKNKAWDAALKMVA